MAAGASTKPIGNTGVGALVRESVIAKSLGMGLHCALRRNFVGRHHSGCRTSWSSQLSPHHHPGLRIPHELVVEVLSPSNSQRDLEVKRELYARFGVPEYLIVDPYQETVVSLTNPSADEGEGRYANEATYRSGEHLPIGSLPGLVIPVAEIFASPL